MIVDKEKDKIREEARAILESFAGKLEKVDIKEKEEKVLENSGMRNEGEGEEGDLDFRKRVFGNVPDSRVERDKIVAEKKKW